MDFFRHLFDTSDFPARWTCGRWSPGHGWLHILSDLAVWSAYFAIPIVLAYFLSRRKDLPFRSIFVLFAAFIVLCGTTHLMEAIIFWWPAYRLAGVIKLLTAVVSWFTVIALVRIAPTIVAMRSPEELEREIAARKEAELRLQRANEELESRVAERTRELTAQRERLITTLASIGDGVITTDVAGRVTSLNPVAEQLTGWPTGVAEGQLLGAVFNIVNESTREPVENPAEKALRDGVIVGLANHTVLIAKDGTERPIDDSAAPIRGNAGEIFGCVLVFRDITERKRHEAELIQRERQFVTLAESIPQLAWIAKPDGEIYWYNRRWYEYTGTTLEQMAGWGWQSVHDAKELPGVLVRWKSSIDTGQPFDMVFPLRGKDGSFRPFLTRVEPVTTDAGEVVRWFGTNTDISEQKLIEYRLRLALDAADLGAWHIDPATETLNSDERFRNVFQGSDSPISYEQAFAAVHPDDRERIRIAVEAATRPIDPTPYSEEHRVVHPEGEVRWVHGKGHANFQGEGAARRIVSFDGTVADITARKRMENNLRELAADLSEANRRKDEFLATLAHELRNPLAPIRNGLKLMQLAGNDIAAIERSRSMMERQLEHMVRLVDDLMDVSRISRGKLELRRELADLSAIVNSAVETSGPLIEQMGHGLTVELPDPPVALNADRTRLAQVFANLLNNSAKYSDPGSKIRLSAERRGSEVAISVSDTGMGIPPDKLASIFDMFHQVDHSLEKSQGGLGIGLTLVKRLVEMHGGTIEATSGGFGKGAEFLVRLPLASRPESQKSGGKTEPVSPPLSLRILIVDDNKDGADSLAMMLDLLGNETHTAYDGQEGVEAAARLRPDAIVFDIGMPKLNGYEACRQLRQHDWAKKIRMIAVTGWGQNEDRERSRDAGFDHHMVKPVDPTALLKLLGDPNRS